MVGRGQSDGLGALPAPTLRVAAHDRVVRMSSPLNPDSLSTCLPTFPYRNSRTKNELRDYMTELPIDAACLLRCSRTLGVADFIASGSPFPATPPAWATAWVSPN